ncbi:hypothetical protein OIO90_004652 [Microbotryomycetes sp. JL221]|nr:hypothetical protein OIO90_004652 [Microbotryomycetes sp. JL221]
MTNPLVQQVVDAAHAFHAKYDPSHDFHHVRRVTLLAMTIARSINSLDVDAHGHTKDQGGHISQELTVAASKCQRVDELVVQLAALAHDMLDKKYLPPDEPVPDTRQYLEPLYSNFKDFVTQDQRELVAKIVDNVSYSKEVKRIQQGKETEWHKTCLELHCVQDADKLDAMGAFGIMRCAAYSAVANRPLYIPSRDSPVAQAVMPRSVRSGAQSPSQEDSAIRHFHDKLFRLEGMMKTDKGKELARRRTEFMRNFVDEVEREWRDVEGQLY